MFTGLVEETGTVRSISGSSTYKKLEVASSAVVNDLRPGDSVAVQGVCQTVTAATDSSFSVEVLAETLKKTTLGTLRPGEQVNLERSVTPSTRLGGHFVQGHVDAMARVQRLVREGQNAYLTVRLPHELKPYVVREGSIAINGVSLTAASISGPDVTVNVIPTTWEMTTLRELRTGVPVNVEVDIIGRYVARMIGFDRVGRNDWDDRQNRSIQFGFKQGEKP